MWTESWLWTTLPLQDAHVNLTKPWPKRDNDTHVTSQRWSPHVRHVLWDARKFTAAYTPHRSYILNLQCSISNQELPVLKYREIHYNISTGNTPEFSVNHKWNSLQKYRNRKIFRGLWCIYKKNMIHWTTVTCFGLCFFFQDEKF